jgi:hypothetical protein
LNYNFLIDGPGQNYNDQDSYFEYSNKERVYDFIFYFDSRGHQKEFAEDRSILELIKERCQKISATFLILGRPKYCTTFFSLVNFLKLNQITARTLVTNVGFVDLTPKKKDILDDILEQKNCYFEKYECEITYFEKYKLSNNEFEILGSLNYDSIVNQLPKELAFHCHNIYLLETPIFDSKEKYQRERPLSFFIQLKETNKLIHAIANQLGNFKIISSPKLEGNSAKYTYDAVHSTRKLHEEWFSKITHSLSEELIGKSSYSGKDLNTL